MGVFRFNGCINTNKRTPYVSIIFFFQAEDGIRDFHVTGVQTCALPIYPGWKGRGPLAGRRKAPRYGIVECRFGNSPSWICLSSVAFDVLFVYPLYQMGLAFSEELSA